jgi:hypothetical protein
MPSSRARVARLQREAEILASLNHLNIAGIFGIEGSAARVPLDHRVSLQSVSSAYDRMSVTSARPGSVT